MTCQNKQSMVWIETVGSGWPKPYDDCIQVEIVMGLEEEFGISVEEESAQSITTVQDAADLIEKLVAKNEKV